MVVFLDLDEETSTFPNHVGSGFSARHSYPLGPFSLDHQLEPIQPLENSREEEGLETTNPNLNSCSAALGCYPIISRVTSNIDQNTLHSLAQTCRQIRAQLLPHRSLLVSQTLRCINETTSLNIKLANGLRGMREEWNNTTYGPNGVRVNRITSGRVGACARDMVEGCKCCGVVVCRNCTIKPPPLPTLKNRHRRLCRTCIKSPLDEHTQRTITVPVPVVMVPLSVYSSSVNECSTAPDSNSHNDDGGNGDNNKKTASPITTRESIAARNRRKRQPDTAAPPFSQSSSASSPATQNDLLYSHEDDLLASCSSSSSSADEAESGATVMRTFTVSRPPCSCATGLPYICQPCGSTLRTSDLTYTRGWTWRKSYGARGLSWGGGLGTGVGGGGLEGVQCGRGSSCLGAREVEKEVSADSGEQDGGSGGETAQSEMLRLVVEQQVKQREGAGGYFVQEVEGIGGRLKGKVKKRVKVGACVGEFEDEGDGGAEAKAEAGSILAKEIGGEVRSWCSWCDRVIMSAEDADELRRREEKIRGGK